MAHLEKHILQGKKMSKKRLRKEARHELKEVAENPEKESKEAKEMIKGGKKVQPMGAKKSNYERHPEVKKRGARRTDSCPDRSD